MNNETSATLKGIPYTLGIDLGIGSCGWALLNDTDTPDPILALGVRMFDVPEKGKERTPTNQIRRTNRLIRRVIKRRRQRMNEVRELFHQHALIDRADKNALARPNLSPWELRASALERPLTGPEMAVALGHIAKHRGFKSNSKRDRANTPGDETSKMLSAIGQTVERLGRWRTAGEMFAKDEIYAGRKRNRDGDYSRSVLRDDLVREVTIIFERQRHMGNALASPDLEREFADTAFFQRPLQDSEHLVGPCVFEPGEKRAAKHSNAFELFRLAARLTSLRIKDADGERPLTPDEIKLAMDDFGAPGTALHFKRLRNLLKIPDTAGFGIPREEESKRDVATRSGDHAAGTKALRSILGDAWKTLLKAPEKIDRIGFVLTFRDDLESISRGLSELDLPNLILDALLKGASEGAFAKFKGAGHLSAKAARRLLPFLMQGMVYSDACAAAGYDHSAAAKITPQSINNPIARKALNEALKQVRAIVREFGLPERVHVELAREVGKSTEERDEIRRGIEKRTAAKERLKAQFAEDVGQSPAGAEDLLRYELWREQNGRCIYSDTEIDPRWLVSSDNRVQVDHILPWSRSGDDSFINKTLCLAKANQDKKGATPFEWIGQDSVRWAAFAARVENNKAFKGRKKRNYLLRDASVLEEKFRRRNLTDTQYATRVLAQILKDELYPDDDGRRIFTRPGALTDRLRRAWGIQGLKKGTDGKRLADDRHHALDALIVAATSDSALQKLTQAAKAEELRGSSRFIANFPPPWPGFKTQVEAKMTEVFVARPERGRVRGEVHKATIRSTDQTIDGPVIYERKAIDKITEADLKDIKGLDRNQAIKDSIAAWIKDGRPKDRPPLSPKGDPIRKVSIKSDKKPDILIRGGAVDRGDMVRVDVFQKPNRRGQPEYYLVPIYPHQVADHENWPRPPNMAAKANQPESEWTEMTTEYEFLWSLYSMSFVELEKSDGTHIEGYFRGLHRGTASITVSPHNRPLDLISSIGAKTLKKLKKYSIDRLGRRFEITKETRTWRGVVCT